MATSWALHVSGMTDARGAVAASSTAFLSAAAVVALIQEVAAISDARATFATALVGSEQVS